MKMARWLKGMRTKSPFKMTQEERAVMSFVEEALNDARQTFDALTHQERLSLLGVEVELQGDCEFDSAERFWYLGHDSGSKAILLAALPDGSIRYATSPDKSILIKFDGVRVSEAFQCV